MNKRVKAVAVAAAIFAAASLAQSCSALNDMASVLANLQRLKFKLAGVRDFRLLGIDLSGKTRLTDFGAGEALLLVQSFRSRKLPVDFILDVVAVNPNDGTGGTRRTTSTLTGLECRLLIDQKPTVTGNIEKPLEIPGTGQESLIPIRLSFDLLEFFGDQRYDDVLGLALAIGGRSRNPARLALDAQPTVQTPVGPITYPGRLTIVSTEFH